MAFLKRVNPTATTLDRIIQKIRGEMATYGDGYPWSVLALFAGVSVSTIFKFRDNGYADSPRLSTIVKIADVFGYDIDLKKVRAERFTPQANRQRKAKATRRRKAKIAA